MPNWYLLVTTIIRQLRSEVCQSSYTTVADCVLIFLKLFQLLLKRRFLD